MASTQPRSKNNGRFASVKVDPKPCIGCGKTIPVLNYDGSKKTKSRYDKQNFCTIYCHWDHRKRTETKFKTTQLTKENL